MENSRKIKSFTSQVQLLLKTNKDFPQQLKQHLLLESNNVKNPLQFIVRLFTEGVLSDESIDPEATCGLKEIIVELAMMIACSKGADAIGGFMKALEGSGNSQLILALRTWLKAEFGIETAADLSEPKGAPVVPTGLSEVLPKKGKNSKEMNSIGNKLVDKIISQVNEKLAEQLEGHLVSKAFEVLNAPQMCSNLVHQNVLDEGDYQLKTTPKAQRKLWAEKAIKAACSKRAVGSLVLALQSSGNERSLTEAYEWLETSSLRKKNYPIALKSFADQPIKKDSKCVKSISNGLQKLATFDCGLKSSTKGPFSLKLSKDKMIAYLPDGTIKLWNWPNNEEKTIKLGVDVKDITWFQYDDEIIVVGTTGGTVYLFDAKTEEEK